MNPQHVLILPGWRNSDAEHWQSRWQAAHGYQRVEQHSWVHPLRGDWIARLEEVLLSLDVEQDGPAVMVAHSLGCVHVAAWAAHSKNTHRVKAALLAAPPDADRADVRELIPGWSPMPLERLPFASVLLASRDDPHCTPERAKAFAAAWGSEFVDIGARGHLNSDSGLGDWPEAYEHLERLMRLQAPA